MTNADEGGFGGQAAEGELPRHEAPDPRGRMHRKKRLMPDADTREFLRAQNVAHVGTVDAKGWPYVVRWPAMATFPPCPGSGVRR